MHDHNNDATNTDPQSQDAVRHRLDALHHKFESQARAQQDSVDMQQIDGLQPEIPKVGSLDAPGG
jgi:hypothetical protein